MSDLDNMTNTKIPLLCAIIGVLTVLTTGCKCQPPIRVIKPVDRVFMHEVGKYTVVYIDEETKLLQTLAFRWPKIVVDGHSFVEYTPKNGSNHEDGVLAIIHIPSVGTVGGAGWDHGKFGRGQTTVIETERAKPNGLRQ